MWLTFRELSFFLYCAWFIFYLFVGLDFFFWKPDASAKLCIHPPNVGKNKNLPNLCPKNEWMYVCVESHLKTKCVFSVFLKAERHNGCENEVRWATIPGQKDSIYCELKLRFVFFPPLFSMLLTTCYLINSKLMLYNMIIVDSPASQNVLSFMSWQPSCYLWLFTSGLIPSLLALTHKPLCRFRPKIASLAT